jgi:hypothetical protein
VGTGAKLVAPSQPPTSDVTASPDCKVPATNGSLVTAVLLVHVHVDPEPFTADTRALTCLPTVAFVRAKTAVVALEIVEHPAGKMLEADATSLVHANH